MLTHPDSSKALKLLQALEVKLDALAAEVAAIRREKGNGGQRRIDTGRIDGSRVDTVVASGVRLLLESQRGLIDAAAVTREEVVRYGAAIKQAANLTLRETRLPGAPIRCVFLVHAFETWDAYGDIYQMMLDDDRFDPLVASIPRANEDGRQRGDDVTSEALTAAGVPHLRLGMEDSWQALDILRALRPDVIFRQSQWEQEALPGFRAKELTFARLCYVPYGTSLVGRFFASASVPAESRGSGLAFDQVYHQLAWRVFCDTVFTQSQFRGFQHSDPAKFVLTGYPKLERLEKLGKNARWPVEQRQRRGYRVIWAPHHSVGDEWLGFGVFHLIYREMLDWARMAPDIDFVLKPHPNLFDTVVGFEKVTQEELDAFLADWQSLDNCALCTGTYGELFGASDLLVTDGVSFLTEYQLFGKPLIFFDSRRRVPFNAIGDAAHACAHTVRTFEEMRAAVLDYRNGAPWRPGAAREELMRMLFPCDASATRIILETIADGIPGVNAAS